MRRVAPTAAAIVAAAAALVSSATLAVDAPGGHRLALVPVDAGHLVLAAVAALVGFAAARRGAAMAVLVLAPVFLPWAPASIPAAFLLWSGPPVLLLWIAFAAIVAQPWLNRAWVRLRGVTPRSAARLAALLAAVVFGVTAWQVAPSIPSGDEPQYLVITQSLLSDGDLQIENNHRRGDYRAYFDRELEPDYLRRGTDGQIYSIHAPGLPVLIAPAFAVGGYPAAVVFLLLLSAAGTGLAWHLAWRISGSAGAAWFAWSAVALCTTTVFQAATVFPDGPAAVIVLTGVWALIRARDEQESGRTGVMPWLLHGAALAALPWLHTRFVVLAAVAGALILLELSRTRNAAAKASAFLLVPAASAVGWILFFAAIYGTPNPAAPYGQANLGSPAHVLPGLAGLFFDQQFGLLAYAPVLAAAVAGGIAMLRSGGRARTLAVELLIIAAPYLLVVTHFAMWWAGWSAPARFFMPVLPTLAIPIAIAWRAAERRGTRACLLALLGLTMFTTGVLVFVNGGRLAYNVRDGYGLLADWMNRSIDLQRGLPSFFVHAARARFYVEIAIWAGAIAAAWLIVRAVVRGGGRLRAATAVVLTLAAAAMGSLTAVWAIEGAPRTTPASAQAALLGQLATGERQVAIDLSSWRTRPVSTLAQSLVIRQPPRPRGLARGDRARFLVPAVPAGEYRLTVEGDGDAGWLTLGIGRDQFALATGPAEEFARGLDIRLPVAVRALVVRGDDSGLTRAFVVRPRTLLPPGHTLSGATALHAVRYGEAIVYFLDEQSYPEPRGFWVAGESATDILIQADDVPDVRLPDVRLSFRNGATTNHMEVQMASGRRVWNAAPGETRVLDVPLEAASGAALVRIAARKGFRPSAVDPTRGDDRLLGVWVEVQNRATPPK